MSPVLVPRCQHYGGSQGKKSEHVSSLDHQMSIARESGQGGVRGPCTEEDVSRGRGDGIETGVGPCMW